MKLLVMIGLIFFHTSRLWGEEAKKAIEVFPSTPFYQFVIYENLVILWIAITGLLIIIRMKLKEIERVQRMGLDNNDDEKEPPLLD